MDIDPHNLGDPVYKADQVVTRDDLRMLKEGFVYQYQEAKWWEKGKKQELLQAVMVVHAIESWLNEGKKVENL